MIAQAAEKSLNTGSRISFSLAPELWVIFLVIVPLALFYAWLLYRSRAIPAGRRRWVLTGLRALALLLLITALFKPVREMIRTRLVRDQVILMVDDSASMGIRGDYQEGRREELARTAGLPAGQDPGRFSRLELVQRTLSRPGGLLERLGERFNLDLYGFSRRLFPLEKTADLAGQGRVTRLGDALQAGLGEALTGRTVGLVVLSDGRSNDGLPPLDAAAGLAAEGIPVHTIRCGREATGKELRNVAVLGINGPESILQNEEAWFKVAVRCRGLAGRSCTLTLVKQPEGAVLAQADAGLTLREGEQFFSLHHRFAEPGYYTLQVGVEKIVGEYLADDNRVTHHLNVLPGRIRVLYVEGYPRYEYRYLKNFLLRGDESIEGQCWLVHASRDFLQEASKGLPHLESLPRRVEDLLKDYHVVVLGEVDPRNLGRTPRESAAFILALKRFVEGGGGLICQAGEVFMPYGYRGTSLEDLLPVVLADHGELRENPLNRAVSFSPVLDNPAAPHEVTRLLRNEETNRLLWREGLEGFFWYCQVRRAKAGATVLLRHPVRENEYGRHVIAAAWEFMRGRVLFLGVDSTWRWRKYYDNKHFGTFWRGAVRFCAEGRISRGSDRAELRLNERLFETGQRVEVTARLREEGFVPSTREECTLYFTDPEGEVSRFDLPRDPVEAGTYRGGRVFRRTGNYAVSIHDQDSPEGAVLARIGFRVRPPTREKSDPTPDAKLLTAVAEQTGGRSIALDEAERILEILPPGGDREVTVGKDPRPTDLWDTPWLLILLIILLGGEWALRKSMHLP